MKENIKSLAYVVFGNTLIAFAISTLVLENNIIAGGVTGFGLIIKYFTG
ncbi:YitT family protein, partial [Desulfitobacterium sp.]